MNRLLSWMVTCAAILAFNFAALPGASAMPFARTPLQIEGAPQAVLAKHRGGKQFRRYGGRKRIHAVRYDGPRVKHNRRRYDGRYGDWSGKRYAKVSRHHNRHWKRYDSRYHGKRYKYRRKGHHYYRDGWWYDSPWWLGVGVGIAVGQYLDVPVYGGYDAHTAWCLRKYRSYNPATNTWFGHDGRYHICISPYAY